MELIQKVLDQPVAVSQPASLRPYNSKLKVHDQILCGKIMHSNFSKLAYSIMQSVGYVHDIRAVLFEYMLL
ncbi:hypothetical protein SADUNF_Sadunf17G0105100 [Salix dunnii]|uniref:Uncharacterized protein n=1 Tax=Salix dunnii TaxID=1413687 RepID=A0A835J3L1_9ROSI|nr:hypothetical protein SADUNF_Sadunf17G0105100 [Salix dunnii]